MELTHSFSILLCFLSFLCAILQGQPPIEGERFISVLVDKLSFAIMETIDVLLLNIITVVRSNFTVLLVVELVELPANVSCVD